MNTATLPAEARRHVTLFAAAPPEGSYRKTWRTDATSGKKSLLLEDVPVFRAGVFRDSMGEQHTWEDLHMEQMVDNFDHLIKSGIMPGAPVRKGHNGFFDSGAAIMDGLIGWHTGLRVEKRRNNVDGQSYNYLLANYEILDEDAAKKIDSGLWKSVSSEVGGWRSNDEAEFWPVYQGVAYVDFPAVEGLTKFGSANGVGTTRSIMIEKENAVDTSTLPGQTGTPATPPAVTPGGQVVTQHAAPTQTFEFTLANGAKTTDFSAVQAELTVLGTFKKETLEAARVDFVSSLVSGNKMLEANREASVAFAKSLDDAQFTAWKASWESAPVVAALGVHGQGTTNHSGQAPAGSPEGTLSAAEQQVKNDQDIVATLGFTMSPEQIKATGAYARLVAAGKTPTL